MRELSTREIQLELFSMLLSLSEVFDEHGIRYSLDGGTLLGAVRHKGFIPWDDDIDILVPRPDFDLLLNNPDWCPDGMMLEGMGINGNPLPFLKLANPKFRAQEAAYEGAFEEHLWVDIFPADSMPQDLNERAGLMRKQQKQQKAAARSVINIDAAISASRGVIKKSLKKFYLPIYKATHSSLYEYQKMTDTARARHNLDLQKKSVMWCGDLISKISLVSPLKILTILLSLNSRGMSLKPVDTGMTTLLVYMATTCSFLL
nr:LicD family protein [Paratractidigestivibacter faecalis]